MHGAVCRGLHHLLENEGARRACGHFATHFALKDVVNDIGAKVYNIFTGVDGPMDGISFFANADCFPESDLGPAKHTLSFAWA